MRDYRQTQKQVSGGKKGSAFPGADEKQLRKKKIIRIGLFVGAALLVVGLTLAVKTGFILNKVSQGNANIFKSIVKSLPGAKDALQGEEEGRVNILLLGMRGENVPGGGLLADTIMVLSIHPKDPENPGDVSKASLISIPRDLYVTVPGKNEKQKINAVYAYGEEREHGGGGIEDMQHITSEVTGLDIAYTAVINFAGFKDLVNALGGITLTLDEPFQEGVQFRGVEARCDGITYTLPSGNVEEKRIQRKNGTYYANPKRYPLCFAKAAPETLECGGNFSLPKGANTLDGDKALCYSRSRSTSNDFDRARRQQQVLSAIKEKALSIGTLADFTKVNAMLDSLGNNATTNLEAWEMKRLFDLYQSIGDVKINQKVLENSEEGLLYAPTETNGAGYILLPLGDNYDRIRDLFKNSLNY